MKAVLAQVNPVVGDLEGNLRLLDRTLAGVQPDRPDIVVLPELFLTGYPPRDLLERGWFVDRAERALARAVELTERYPGIGVLFGAVGRNPDRAGRRLLNVALLAESGRELFRQAKSLLAACDVFDEARYFQPAAAVRTFAYKGESLGVTVCEDACIPDSGDRGFDPVGELARQGATLFLNIAAAPFAAGRDEARFRLLQGHARRHVRPFLFANQVGGNDELVFDGRSLALDGGGRLLAVLPGFSEAVRSVDTRATGAAGDFTPPDEVESVYQALVLGVRDYLRKCGFSRAVLGLSGGIDSAVTCCLAAAAVGPENVLGVTMPSDVSSAGSVEDSRRLARNLGVELLTVPIVDVYQSYLGTLKPALQGRRPDVTEENIQARIRGNVLMAISNKLGHLVLATGNKSELAVGYCTLYGDMSGGLAVLSDVPKTMVYRLARYINREREVIPQSSIEKPPSAELRPGQTDQDTLPPYDILDRIIRRYVDEDAAPAEIVREGVDAAVVEQVVRLVDRSEYKRRQAAPGLKVTGKAFGMGRRFPVAARYEY